MRKVLLDTDPGSDIDDAIAIAYLLAHPDCDLVGITTVTGDVQKRADIAGYVCRAMGRPEVPVLAGLSEVLVSGSGQPHVPHWKALPEDERGRVFADDGVDFLRGTLRKDPGQVTLLTIGPLTNVAALFASDPRTPGLCDEIVSMSGVFFSGEGALEWNARVDPVAAAIVYRHSVRHTSIGLDVTVPCALPAEEVRRRFRGCALEAVLPMAEVFFQGGADKITFHDILAAAVVFHPELVRTESGTVTVDLCGHPGATIFQPGVGPHQVGRQVDPEAFFERFFSVF